MFEIYAQYGPSLVAGILFVVGLGVAALIVRAPAWAQRALGTAWAEVVDAVREVNQTYVDGLKAGRLASSPGGERLTEAERAEAKARAVAIAKSNLGPKGIRRLAKIVGVDVEQWLGSKVEAAVSTIKTGKPPVGPS